LADFVEPKPPKMPGSWCREVPYNILELVGSTGIPGDLVVLRLLFYVLRYLNVVPLFATGADKKTEKVI